LDKLWVNLLSSKYRHGISILEATDYQGSSCVWKAITKTVEVLKFGFKTRIGRGEVSLWYDKWLADDYLCNLVPYVHISETNLRLREIYHHGRWNFSHLTTQIPLSIQLQIQIIFIDESSKTPRFGLIPRQVCTLLRVVISG